jgi:hypothetical protein
MHALFGISSRDSKLEAGISLLESSFCFVLFCGLLLLGAGLWNYVDVNNGLTNVADRYAYGSGTGVYQYYSAVGRYDINLTRLRDEYRSVLATQALRELTAEVNAKDLSQVRLDFAITTLSVDTANGNPKSLKPLNPTDIISVGGSSVPAFLLDGNVENGEADLKSAMDSYVSGASNSIAIPTQSFGLNNSKELYLPEVPIIAVRAIYNYSNSGILKALAVLDQPYGWDIKVGALRGEVG